MISKETTLKTTRVALYILLTLAFFFTWQIRKEFIVGPVPGIIHIGLFWLLFTIVSKVRSKATDESSDAPRKEMHMILKIALSFIGLSLLLFLLAPLFL